MKHRESLTLILANPVGNYKKKVKPYSCVMNEDEFCNEATCERNRAGEKHPKHDLTKTLENRSKSLANLVKDGAKFGGMPLGAGIGFLFGGPMGAAVGTGIGIAIERIGDEIGNRYLAKRERERVGGTIILACEKIKQNIDLGMKYRTDGFFDNKNGERSAAEEVIEGILIASQKEYQEKKLPFYSNLLANLAFHAEIDRAQANLLLKLAERLSYRQLCLLSLFVNKAKFNLKQDDYRNQGIAGADKVALLQEITELASQGMLNASGEAILGLSDIKPGKMNVQGTGVTLYNLMELGNITHELEEIARLLR